MLLIVTTNVIAHRIKSKRIRVRKKTFRKANLFKITETLGK